MKIVSLPNPLQNCKELFDLILSKICSEGRDFQRIVAIVLVIFFFNQCVKKVHEIIPENEYYSLSSSPSAVSCLEFGFPANTYTGWKKKHFHNSIIVINHTLKKWKHQ